MECPKCHTKVNENQAVCPKCHKVLLLDCPNCHSLGESAICQKCGYTILVKCSKCGKTVPVTREKCKCGFSTSTSLAYQECESDEFASIIIKFGSLKAIRRNLKSQELYTKFFFKLKNLLFAQTKGVDCKFITYGETFVINMNKELSLTTSAHKAVRLALKILNAFVGLNSNVIEELAIPLNLNLTVIKKASENLQELSTYENNVKSLSIKKDAKKYLKGLQIVLDQYVSDEINKEYKVDSLYSLEENGKTTMFYEVILDSYILPPSVDKEEPTINAVKKNIVSSQNVDSSKDIYSFKVFDINAKCMFERTNAIDLIDRLSNIDFDKQGKIIAIRSLPSNAAFIPDIINLYVDNGYRVLRVSCTEELAYKPWGFFETIFKDYFGLSLHKNYIDLTKINENSLNLFKPLFDFVCSKPIKAMSPEDARFAYMEYWNKFLSILSKTVIVVEGFENIDDTSLQTLELYFDKYKAVKPNFVFVTSNEDSVHSKIKSLLRTPIYTEYTLNKVSIDSCLGTLKSDAADFIQSFYFEKIKENFSGSFLYFVNAIEYLKETGVLIDFENRLLIKNKKSVIIPKDLQSLLKARMKHLSKNVEISFILAYVTLLGPRVDLKTLLALGVKELDKNLEVLSASKIICYENDIVYVNNFVDIAAVVNSSLKNEAEAFLVKNLIAQLGKGLEDSRMAFLMGRLSMFKEEYLTLWKNSQFAIKVGDYDAYLKNCLGFLSLVEHIESNISKEDIEDNKKEVYNNILMCLYSYSPAKIYFIENVLLMDAINEGDDEKIVKLSNLMLQGALISSNYTDALGLLHNILSRMPHPTLKVDGSINTKFLLLSLVNIEILYNIGDYKQCVEVAEDILSVLSPDLLEKVKPASFSTNLFVSHILETLRLVGFSKLYLLDEDLEAFFDKVKETLNVEFPEKDCILAVKDFLAGKVYDAGNIEEYSAFSKVIYLILQEFSILKEDYKRFAQNVYQAKILASELHQKEIEMFCDLLIAYAYSKIGIEQKALSIYSDVLQYAEKTAMFNILAIAKFLLAKLKFHSSQTEEAFVLINDTLALIQKHDNQAQILYALFEKLYIDVVKTQGIASVDIETEEQKLFDLKEKLAKVLS